MSVDGGHTSFRNVFSSLSQATPSEDRGGPARPKEAKPETVDRKYSSEARHDLRNPGCRPKLPTDYSTSWKYWRRSPLVFSFDPRCQGLCGSAKNTGMPVSTLNWACADISFPRSQVSDRASCPGSVDIVLA